MNKIICVVLYQNQRRREPNWQLLANSAITQGLSCTGDRYKVG